MQNGAEERSACHRRALALPFSSPIGVRAVKRGGGPRDRTPRADLEAGRFWDGFWLRFKRIRDGNRSAPTVNRAGAADFSLVSWIGCGFRRLPPDGCLVNSCVPDLWRTACVPIGFHHELTRCLPWCHRFLYRRRCQVMSPRPSTAFGLTSEGSCRARAASAPASWIASALRRPNLRAAWPKHRAETPRNAAPAEVLLPIFRQQCSMKTRSTSASATPTRASIAACSYRRSARARSITSATVS